MKKEATLFTVIKQRQNDKAALVTFFIILNKTMFNRVQS